MCGISGFVTRQHLDAAPILERGAKQLSHRGPDGDGYWSSVENGVQVGLAQTRLAIIDLSSAGRQPMISEDERFVLVYNGEVFNYLELRSQLCSLGHRFHSSTDTEVVLNALIEWQGDAFRRFNGMWALALLDRKLGTLLLSRDRMGVKPLYYTVDREGLYFASEIKAILAMTARRYSVNHLVAARYLQQGLLDAQEETFFNGILSLPPATFAMVDLKAGTQLGTPRRFWAPPTQVVEEVNEAALGEQVRELLFDSVRLRLRSDVPVGVLLSGGLDSSAIATAMQAVLGPGADIHALSSVSTHREYSEEPFIDIMGRFLDCTIHKVRLRDDPQFLFDALHRVSRINDEPIGGFANVAHWLLMEQAKESGVTVVLTGQGADELLGGYKKYVAFYTQDLIRHRQLGAAVRTLGAFALNGTVLSQFKLTEARRYLPRILQPRQIDVRGPRLRDVTSFLPLGLGGGLQARQAADLTHLSVPALLHYEDRMSMSHSREMRVPFLDYRLVELLLPLAGRVKLRDGWTKWILRHALRHDLPKEICWRKDKQGFNNPQAHWLRSELSQTVESFLASDFLTEEWGLLDRSALQRRFSAYRSQSRRFPTIWDRDVLSPILLEMWARQFEPYLAS
jgi:asparagine synthase (glutamine-hydrolysing)